MLQSPAERADAFALEAGMQRFQLAGSMLRVYFRAPGVGAPVSRLEIHIESDGAPWLSADLPPRDPTPRSRDSLRLAAAAPTAPVAYIGRPCQYLDEDALEQCDPALWRRARYGETAIAQVDRAIDALVREWRPASIALVGYSGGGVVAALVAARRKDVSCLVTLASPLDTEAWAGAIGVTPLSASLNPADRPAPMAQTHFAGAADADVPPDSIRAYLARAPQAKFIKVADFTHECCWVRDWLRLREQSCLTG